MDAVKFKETVLALVADGKGILAADESTGSIEKKLAKINVASTEENRRAYRDMLLSAEGLEEYISGVILYDETIRQKSSTGESFVALLQKKGIVLGIKVDEGLTLMKGSTEEKITKGLEGLPPRLKEYVNLGARFAKWRAVVPIDGERLPTDAKLRHDAKDLAAYAKMCQDAGLVPIVEPEVLMDGANTQKRCEEVSRKLLTFVFEELKNAGVAIEGMLLKTNMIVPGKESGEQVPPGKIAEATLRLFKEVLPGGVLGQAFLSGGQSEIEATINLNEMNKRGPHPWKLTFSYGRALQESALMAWRGRPENVPAAQRAFLHRAHMNSLAARGEYEKETSA